MSFISTIGHIASGLRAGEETLILNQPPFAGIPREIVVTSPAFLDGQSIPARYTVSGEEISPPLNWTNVPAAAREIVLIMEDYDVPLPKAVTHLIAFGISARTSGLVEGALPTPNVRGKDPLPRLGRNSLGFQRYEGPAALPGHGPHHYVFEVFALDRPLDFDAAPNKKEIVSAMEARVLAVGRLTGTFERK
jgi:Raf kinase inhibitor-like YbhB/YbcL family protein